MLSTPAYFFSILLGLGVLSLIGCILLGILCYRLIVDRGRLLLRVEELIAQRPGAHPGGLKHGSYLSDVALPTLATSASGETGRVLSISQVITARDQPQLLLFLDSDCLYSRALARELSALFTQPQHPEIVAVIGGDEPSGSEFPPFAGILLHDPQRQAASLYGVTATPAGYLVAPSRHTASPLLIGPATLVQAARGQNMERHLSPLAVTTIPTDSGAHREPLSAGQPVPPFQAISSTGETWTPASHIGEPYTLLLIDPDCPPCREAVELLGECQRNASYVISQGTPEDPLNMQAAALPGVSLLFQADREVSRALQVLETPVLYAIDGSGTISAGPFIGLQEIRNHWENELSRVDQAGVLPRHSCP